MLWAEEVGLVREVWRGCGWVQLLGVLERGVLASLGGVERWISVSSRV